MRKLFIALLLLTASVTACNSQILKNPRVLGAIVNAAKAFTLSDSEVIAITDEFMALSDSTNTIAPDTSAYAVRLRNLTGNHGNEGGMNLNFKVYMTEDINAFATANGSVRVYSGLMDVMSDQELLAILGHEIGHVANNDVKDAMRNAYVTAAAANAAAATGKTIEALTDSQVGQLAQLYSQTKFSRTQEYAADEYAVNFLARHGYDPMVMTYSLEKLLSLSESGGSGSNIVANLFSSHPDTKARAEKARELAAKYKK